MRNDFEASNRASVAYRRGELLKIVAMSERVRCLLLFKSREELQC